MFEKFIQHKIHYNLHININFIHIFSVPQILKFLSFGKFTTVVPLKVELVFFRCLHYLPMYICLVFEPEFVISY